MTFRLDMIMQTKAPGNFSVDMSLSRWSNLPDECHVTLCMCDTREAGSEHCMMCDYFIESFPDIRGET
jgi:hypothetical protein